MLFYRQKELNNNIAQTHIAKYRYVKMYSRYIPIKLLTANKFWLLFTTNAYSIRDLTSIGSIRTFTESSVLFRCFQNTAPFYKHSGHWLKSESRFELLHSTGKFSTLD